MRIYLKYMRLKKIMQIKDLEEIVVNEIESIVEDEDENAEITYIKMTKKINLKKTPKIKKTCLYKLHKYMNY